MTITSLDLKFRQSQRMADVDDGGGRMSGALVMDGAVNNVFSDLSDANTIIGNVSLRKVFAQVDTANADAYLGPFVFLTDPPVNPTVTVLAFNTGSVTDERRAAQDYVESYRIIGVKSSYILYGDHFPGQMTLQVYCRAEVPSPDIGDVLCLSIERAGYTPAQQFVKVQDVATRATRTFTDAAATFQRDVLVIKLTSELQTTFPGQQDPRRIDANVTAPTVVRGSQVNDGAKFYGLAELAATAATNDTSVQVATPYLQIVPTSQGETPVVDQLAGLAAVSYVPCGAPGGLTWSGSMGAAANAADTRYLGSGVVPGSLTASVGSVVLRDDGHGGLTATDPGDTGWSGSCDYASGAVSIVRAQSWYGAVTVQATQGAAMATQTFSRALPIIAANRNISHVFQLPGQLSPGTVTIDYLALGQWIRLTDTGRGRAEGQPGEGSAIVTYATGSIALTLGALPDVDSAILVAWGTDLRARNSAGEITVPAPTFRQQLDHGGIDPGSITMTWVSGGVTKTATVSAAGDISGAAGGRVDHASGLVEFSATDLPDSGEMFHYAYSYVDPSQQHSETFTPTESGGAVSVTLAHAAKAHSVVARWNHRMTPSQGYVFTRPYVVADDGAGGWRHALSGTNTINYATGAITLTVI